MLALVIETNGAYMENTYTINGTEYIVDEFDAGWSWSADRHECNDFYPTQIEALQSAIDFASAEEQKNTDEYDAMADIREQSRKEARSGI
jgi:hypothetical protein